MDHFKDYYPKRFRMINGERVEVVENPEFTNAIKVITDLSSAKKQPLFDEANRKVDAIWAEYRKAIEPIKNEEYDQAKQIMNQFKKTRWIGKRKP